MNLFGKEKGPVNNSVFSNEGHWVFYGFTFAGTLPRI